MRLLVRKGTQLNGWRSRDSELSKRSTGATPVPQLPGEMFVMWRVRKKKKKKKRTWWCRRAKPTTARSLSKSTARSYLLSPGCVRADMDGLRWAFGRLHRAVGVLCYERVSGTCLELLSAGKVVFWGIQRLSVSHSLIITLSQVTNRCCRRLAEPLFWLIPVNTTLAETCQWHCKSLYDKR